MRALVTGGAGFIGSAVVDLLVSQGHEVYAVDDLSSGKLGNLAAAREKGRIHFHRFDLRTPGMREILSHARPEVVFHLAAQPAVPASVVDPTFDAQVNILGLLNLLEGCVASEVRKIVFASSGGTIYGPQDRFPVKETAHGSPMSPYGITKRASEDYLRFYRSHHGLDFTSLALANVYGPRQDPHGEAGVVAIFARRLVQDEPCTIFGTGDITRDFVYVDDVAAAFDIAADRGSGETVNIGTGVETSIAELYRMMADSAGVSREPEYGPERPGDIPRSALDPSKAAKVLHWFPEYTLEEGVKETLGWFREELEEA